LCGVADGILFKERLQDAADATAFAPSVLHARGMNLIAMSNLAMAAILAVLIGVKIVQILLFIATAIACAPKDPDPACPYLGSQISPYGQYVQYIDQAVRRVNGALAASSTATAKVVPYLAAERA